MVNTVAGRGAVSSPLERVKAAIHQELLVLDVCNETNNKRYPAQNVVIHLIVTWNKTGNTFLLNVGATQQKTFLILSYSLNATKKSRVLLNLIYCKLLNNYKITWTNLVFPWTTQLHVSKISFWTKCFQKSVKYMYLYKVKTLIQLKVLHICQNWLAGPVIS